MIIIHIMNSNILPFKFVRVDHPPAYCQLDVVTSDDKLKIDQHVQYFGIVDLDMDLDRVQSGELSLLASNSSKKYTDHNEIKQEWITFLRNHDQQNAAELRALSPAFDDICIKLLQLVKHLQSKPNMSDMIILFSESKRFRVCFIDPTLFYSVMSHESYEKLFISQVAPQYYPNDIVEWLDANIYEREIKPDILFPVWIRDINKLDAVRIVSTVGDEELCERISAFRSELHKRIPKSLPKLFQQEPFLSSHILESIQDEHRIVQKCYNEDCRDHSFELNRKRIRAQHDHEPDLEFGQVYNMIEDWNQSEPIKSLVHRIISNDKTIDKSTALDEFRRRKAELDTKVLATVNQHWAWITKMTRPVVVQRLLKEVSGIEQYDILLQEKTAFICAKSNWIARVWTESKKSGCVVQMAMYNIAEWWFTQRDQRQYDQIVFDPRPDSATANAKNYNLWNGLRINMEMAMTEGEGGNVQPMLDHLRYVWCQNDEVAFKYLINWFALLVQQPHIKPGTAIVVRGKQGSGKGIVVAMLRQILGLISKHVMRIEELLDKFNGPLLRDALFVYVDETSLGSDKKNTGTIKTLITEAQHRLEDKFLPSYVVNSYTHYVFASNESFVVTADPNDRRWLALETADTYSGPQNATIKEYFDRLMAVSPYAFANYLYHVDLAGFNVRDVPRTAFLRDQQVHTEHSKGSPAAWLYTCLKSGDWPIETIYNHDTFYEKQKLYQSYKETYSRQHPYELVTILERVIQDHPKGQVQTATVYST